MKPKKNIKFKIQYVPLTDDRINAHKDFDALMAAYVVAPKPNLFQRWLNNRYMLFSSGLVIGLTFSALLFFNKPSNNDTVTTSQPATQQTTTTNQTNETTPSTNPVQSNVVKTPESNQSNVNVDNTSESNQTVVAKSTEREEPIATSQNQTPIPTKPFETTSVATNHTQNDVETESNKTLTPVIDIAKQANENETESDVDQVTIDDHVANTAQQNVESNDAKNLKEVNVQVIESDVAVENSISRLNDLPPTRSDDVTIESDRQITEATIETQDTQGFQPINDDSVANENITTVITAEQIDTVAKSDSTNQIQPIDVASVEEAKSGNKKKTDESKGKNATSTKPSFITKWFERSDSTNATEVDGGSSFSSKLNPAKENPDSFINHYAQVSFVTPLSSNGAEGFKYKHYFSLNILQGNTGALEGLEIGGLANINKGYMRGVQFGGLLNYVGGSVRGAQFGGLANTSASLQGAQFGGVANVNRLGGFGFQAGGVANVSTSNERFNGWQVAGAANYVGGDFRGVQLAGAANVAVGTVDGGQISGAFNVANNANGFQLGVINFARKMNGFQFGVINLADTMQGGSVGIINASLNGQFSVDLWTSDYFQFNGGLKIGNKTVYNVFAFGVSPFGQSNSGVTDSSLILVKNPLPFGFGFGLGAHLPIKKAFVNIDGMSWMVHDRYFSWVGINMLNQLRVTGGYRIHKYFGVYAGPVANVSLQDNQYKSLRDNALWEYNGNVNKMQGWIGFVAGVQLF